MTTSPQNPVIMFDYDGVIADSLDIYFAEFVHICDDMGIQRLNSREKFLALSEGNAIRQLLWAGFPLWRLRRMARQFRPRLEAATRRVEPFEGMPELVREFAQRFPTYVITSNATETIHWFLKTHAVEGISGVIGADQEKSKVKKIRRIMRGHPGQAPYYIGDTKGDVLEARRAGAVPVAVTWGWHGLDKVLEGRPEHVVESPAELRALFLGE